MVVAPTELRDAYPSFFYQKRHPSGITLWSPYKSASFNGSTRLHNEQNLSDYFYGAPLGAFHLVEKHGPLVNRNSVGVTFW